MNKFWWNNTKTYKLDINIYVTYKLKHFYVYCFFAWNACLPTHCLNQLSTPHLRFSSIPLSIERTTETSQIHSIAITKQKKWRGISWNCLLNRQNKKQPFLLQLYIFKKFKPKKKRFKKIWWWAPLQPSSRSFSISGGNMTPKGQN